MGQILHVKGAKRKPRRKRVNGVLMTVAAKVKKAFK